MPTTMSKIPVHRIVEAVRLITQIGAKPSLRTVCAQLKWTGDDRVVDRALQRARKAKEIRWDSQRGWVVAPFP